MFRSKSVDFSWIRREQRRRRRRSPAGRSLSQIGVERLTETGCGSMPGSVVELSPAVGIRRNRGLSDINPAFVSRSGLSTSSEVETSRGSLRIQHRPSSSPAGAGGGATDGHSRFPKLNECAHFHYEVVDLGPVTLQLHEDALRPWATAEEGSSSEPPRAGLNATTWAVQVSSRGKSWIVRRTLDNFRLLDDKLHRCIYDRKFSNLPDLNTANFDQDEADAIRPVLSEYLTRLSHLAGNLMNCGPVLNWLELDNRGHRLIALEDADINTPAVAAAYAVRRYAAQASDEISFEVGDMISVIDMPPPEESVWWRGKRGFDVGFFPSECVRLIGDKVPKGLPLAPPASASPILSHSAPSSLPPFNPTVASSAVASSAVVTASAALATAHEGGMELKRQSSSSLQLPAKPVLRKHGKLISFFRSFILSRPSRRKLKQSGILKERVFGCDLGEHLLNSGRDVPLVLKCCAEFIETHGIVDGIYRLSGVTSNIQKLRHAFDEDRIPGLNEDEAIRQDIHAVSSLLKMYFRELPNPLCTYQLYDQFVTAVQGPEDLRLAKMRQVVQQLPPPHYRTLEYLMRHLALVASESESTGMTAKNVAIVWAPNLLRCKELEVGGVAALQGVGVQAVVTEYLVRFVDLIFSDKIPVQAHTSSIDTPKRSRPKSLAISTPTKLLSLEEARLRALQAAEKNESSYIEVGGGPASLPPKYHTVIELPDRKRSLKNKKSPSGWKSFFAKGRSQSSTSTSQAKAQRKASSASAGSTGHVSRKDSSLAGVPGRATVTYTRQRLRPVKSAESLVSSAAPSNRNSITLESPPPPTHPVNIIVSPVRTTAHPIPLAPPTPPPTPPPVARVSPTATVSSEASRCHSRSVSHDSYFRILNLAVVGGRELCLEEEGSDLSKDSLHFMEENQRSWLSYASNGSDVRCNMTLDDSDLKVMSSREMLADPAPHKASSDESAVDGSHPDDRHDLGVANPTYDALPTTTPLTANLQHIQAEVYHNHLALAASPSPDDTEAQIPDLPLEDASPVSPSPLFARGPQAPPPKGSSQSSFSYAAATVSENESFTLHSPSETLDTPERQSYSLLAEIDAQAARNASSCDSGTAETQALLSYENLHVESSTCNDLYGNLSFDHNDATLDDNGAYENVEDATDAPAQVYENLTPELEAEVPGTELAYEKVEAEPIPYENFEHTLASTNLSPTFKQELAAELSYENVEESLTYENVDTHLGEIPHEVYENIEFPRAVLAATERNGIPSVSPVPVGRVESPPLVPAEPVVTRESTGIQSVPAREVEEVEEEATNYENVVIPGEVNVYEDVIPPPPLVEPNTEEVSALQYQQVQVLRRSILEVNSLFLPSEPSRPASELEQVASQEVPPTSQFPTQQAAEPILRVPLSLSLPSLAASSEKVVKTNFSLPLTPTSPPRPEPPLAAYQEVTSKRKIESEIGRDLLHAGKMRSELERVRQDEPMSLSPTSAPPPLPIKKRNSGPSPTAASTQEMTPASASGKSSVSPSHPAKDERRKESKPLWRPGHERKASVKELLSKFETETSPGEPGGKRLGRATSNGELKVKETRLDRKSESENSHCFEDKNLASKDWLSRTKSLDRMVLTTLDPQTDFNLSNIDKSSAERLKDHDEDQAEFGLKAPSSHGEPIHESLKDSSGTYGTDTSPVLGDSDVKTVLLSASVDINDPCARLRIERYKAERRSFLREKFKPESFRGEKDDVSQRLKQKASSPTSDGKETASVVDVNSLSSGADPVSVPSPPVVVSDSNPPGVEKPKDPDVIDEDVNVRERAARFARSQPVHSHPSAKRKKEDANLSSSEETSDPRVPAFSSPSPLKSASMSSINSAKSPRRIRDMAAMFEVSSPSSWKP